MENQESKVIHDRLNGLEGSIKSVSGRVDSLDEKLDSIDDKHDERHLSMKIELTELKGSSKATADHTKRMANSIEGLVVELKQANSRTDDRFHDVNSEVRSVKEKLESSEESRAMKLEEKKLSNRTLGFIIAGGFAIMQVIIQVIAPLLFGG